MQSLHLMASPVLSLILTLMLAGCASHPKPLHEVRDFAAESARLGAFSELTTRYRNTYQREQAYLSPAADSRERVLDASRRAAADDFLHIQKSVVLYMQTLGKLAGGDQYDFSRQVKDLAASIKAWPDSGLNQRHVTAYADLGRLLGRLASASYQQRAVHDMAGEGGEPVQQLLDAMTVLLRMYDKSNQEEKKIVQGFFDVNIPFADAPKDSLLAALARTQAQDKHTEYSLITRRIRLAEKNLDTIAQGHRQLLDQLGQLSGATAQTALNRAGANIRNSRAALDSAAYQAY
ncbi:hypothetical protein [Janthinobacterium agaricidamnosum]|nr:hypothetical protein [Janthinobacterium agaricidamnosum]